MDVVAWSLVAHFQYKHYILRGLQWDKYPPLLDPKLYLVSFPYMEGSMEWFGKWFKGLETSHTNLRINSVHCHVWNIIVIMKEDNLPQPQCPGCNIVLPWLTLNKRHPNTALCTGGAKRNHWSLAEEEAWAGYKTAFWEYSHPLSMVTSFSYLIRILTEMEYEFPAVVYKGESGLGSRGSWVGMVKTRRHWGSSTWPLYRKSFFSARRCGYVARWHWTCGYIQIVLTSMQKVDNVIPT